MASQAFVETAASATGLIVVEHVVVDSQKIQQDSEGVGSESNTKARLDNQQTKNTVHDFVQNP